MKDLWVRASKFHQGCRRECWHWTMREQHEEKSLSGANVGHDWMCGTSETLTLQASGFFRKIDRTACQPRLRLLRLAQFPEID
jgi:hypothetical protein